MTAGETQPTIDNTRQPKNETQELIYTEGNTAEGDYAIKLVIKTTNKAGRNNANKVRITN